MASREGCKEGCVQLALPIPPTFSLQKAVCSYGFFMMAPNHWVATSATSGFLERPLRLLDGRVVLARISESILKLNICILGVHELSDADQDCILAQVVRMLRLSDMESSVIAAFHALHVQARNEGFGRLFRSPTLFEDMIKSLLLCNCGWGRTLAMARALCEVQAELKGLPLGCPDETINGDPSPVTPKAREVKRKRGSKKGKHLEACKSLKFDETSVEGRTTFGRVSLHVELVDGRHVGSVEETYSTDANQSGSVGNAMLPDSETRLYPATGAFPTPEELSGLDVSFLAKRCGLGYRAKPLWKLAKDICDGVVDLQALESPKAEPPLQLDDVRSKLLQLHGFGPFTCANVMMCIGDYSTIPSDTETVRHLKQIHGKSSCTLASVAKDVAAVYAQYAPYQFLSYWFELWCSYERKFGKLSCMDPRSYGLFTGRNMRKKV